MRRFLRVLRRIGFGVLLALLLLEITLQVLQRTLHPALYTLNAELGWRLSPDLDRVLADEDGRTIRMRTGAEGLRIPARAGAVAERQGGVLFLGDSFTMGGQVEAEECFAFLVGQELASGLPCINAGVGGWSTWQEALALEELLARFRPRLVVLVVYENDFVDNLMPYFSGLGPRPHLWIDGDGFVHGMPSEPATFDAFLPAVPAAFWLYRHSAIFRSYLKNVFLPRNADALASREASARDRVNESAQRIAMAHALEVVRRAVAATDARWMVCAIPSREQVQESEAPPSHAWLAANLEELGVPYLSLWPSLKEAGVAANYYPKDIHFNRLGHANAARALTPVIREALR
ncbi:MAG: SGNH/GDSL hydrolase family protein [Planctomycetota bacterium]